MKYISMILAEKIIGVLEGSGAKATEKLAALEVARAIVPFTKGAVMNDDDQSLLEDHSLPEVDDHCGQHGEEDI